jgi:hypothetical protein
MKNLNKILTLTLFAAFISISAQAQTIVVPDTLNGWDQTWVANFNASQASFSNWSEGGVNTVSGTASTIYTKYFRSGKYTYGFRVNMRYGQAKINGQDVRKSDDLISIRNRFTYDLNEEKTYSAFGSVQFRSQFADGFEYETAANGGDSLISGFMAPAYFTETAGIELTPNENLAFEAGLALKQTYIRNDDLSTIYGLSQGDNFRSEGGLSLGASYQNTIMDNIMYYTSIETFTNFLMSVNKTDVFWSNEITGQINSMINAKFQFELRYDDDFSSEVQLKQVFAAGLTINLY